MKKILIISMLMAISFFTFSTYVHDNDRSYSSTDLRFPIGEPIPTPRNPFGSLENTPQLIMIYNNTEYFGQIRNAVNEYGDVNNQLPTVPEPRANITTILPEQTANVSKGASVTFAIRGNPSPEVQPNSMSVTAYTIDGQPLKVLSLSQENEKDSFTINLEKGKYVLLAVAIWLPNSDVNYITTGGYVSYTFKVNVI